MAGSKDIEDVLSSIRRLVSDDAAKVEAEKIAASAPPAPALLLEQARRVTDPEDPFQTIQAVPEPAPQPAAKPDGPAPNASDAPVLLHPRRAEPEAAAKPAPKPAEDAPAPTPAAIDLAALESAAGGEDALRRLIADVVREELAGDLGERITRNVRKLVRREIRRVLANDGFD